MLTTIIITSLVVSGISGFLALLLIIAERFISNYGECEITINNEKKLTVAGGSSLLSSLNSEKIFLPSACGGRGTCAYCKCKVLQGGGTVLPIEESLIDKEELANQIRLACQVKVKQDMAVEIPDELFNIQEFQATVTVLKHLTYDIKLVRLKLKNPPEIHFTPGQYVQLFNDPYEKVKGRVSRAYSIASSGKNAGEIDLMIRLVPEGIVTTWVHSHLKEGKVVTFTGPMGDFRLHNGFEEIIMMAGGSGMAPMVSLLDELARRKDLRKVTFFFGVQAQRDLFYLDEMKLFEKTIPDFTFVPVLSQPGPDDHWEGLTGLITEPVKEHLTRIDTSKNQAYLCGSPGMINACVNLLKEYGITGDRIFYDPFA